MNFCPNVTRTALIAFRLWLVEQLRQIASWIEDLIKAITQRAEIEIEVCMAGTSIQALESLCPSESFVQDTPIYNGHSRSAGLTGYAPMVSPLHRISNASAR